MPLGINSGMWNHFAGTDYPIYTNRPSSEYSNLMNTAEIYYNSSNAQAITEENKEEVVNALNMSSNDKAE